MPPRQRGSPLINGDDGQPDQVLAMGLCLPGALEALQPCIESASGRGGKTGKDIGNLSSVASKEGLALLPPGSRLLPAVPLSVGAGAEPVAKLSLHASSGCTPSEAPAMPSLARSSPESSSKNENAKSSWPKGVRPETFELEHASDVKLALSGRDGEAAGAPELEGACNAFIFGEVSARPTILRSITSPLGDSFIVHSVS